MRTVFRGLKNEFYNYDEGERLVRESTSNDETPPTPQQMLKICKLIDRQSTFQTTFRMLLRRVVDYEHLAHVEKSLTIIEYLCKNADKRFIRYMKQQRKKIGRLRKYQYWRDGRDYGQLVRRKATICYTLLSNDVKLREARQKAQERQERLLGKKSKPKAPAGRAPSATSTRSHGRQKSHDRPAAKKKPKKAPKKAPEPVPEPEPEPEAKTDNFLWDDDFAEPQDLLTGGNDWLSEFNAAPVVDSGAGVDGGMFQFGDDDFAPDDSEFWAEQEEKERADEDEQARVAVEEAGDVDAWLSSLTNLDNPLDAPPPKAKGAVKKTGKSMAQMAAERGGGTSALSTLDSSLASSINAGFGAPPTSTTTTTTTTTTTDPFDLSSFSQPASGTGTGGGFAFASAYSAAPTSSVSDPFAGMGMSGQPQPQQAAGFGYQPRQPQPQPTAFGGGGYGAQVVPATIPPKRDPTKTNDPFADIGSGLFS